MSNLEHIYASQCTLGEGPVWHAAEAKLYFVDIMESRIHSYDPASGELETFQFDDYMCALGIRESGGWVVATRKHFAFWDGKSTDLDIITEIEGDLEGNRFNDGAVDRQGCFWVGTMSPPGPNGSLYRLNTDLSVDVMEKNVVISNGIGWSPDNTIMYYTDSDVRTIFEYAYDAETGAISNRNHFLHNADEEGIPDGMTVDSEGYIWTARWDGANVRRYTPQAELVEEIEFPVSRVTSCTFGGADLKDLYFTTAGTGINRDSEPMAGDIFRLRVDVAGMPEPTFKG